MYLFAGMLTRLTKTSFRIQSQSQGHKLYGHGQGQGRCILKDFSRTFTDLMFHRSLTTLFD